MKTTVSINTSQLDLLKFIAKYRFVSVSHIQRNFGYKSRTSVNNKLKRLVDAGFVGMNYDTRKKLFGAPATFYLTPQGLREVQKSLSYITDTIIKNAYNDKGASEALIQESGELFELASSLTKNYSNIKALTARQLGDLEYFPKPLPHIYIARKQDDMAHRFFLYYFRETKRYDVAVRANLAKLVAYNKTNNYAESGNEFPIVLLVCETPSIERLAQRFMRSALDKSGATIFTYTTSYRALVEQDDADQPIWSSIEAVDSLINLGEVVS